MRVSRVMQVADRLVDLAEPGGEIVNAGLDVGGLAGQCLLAGLDLVQQVAARVSRGHAARQEGAEATVSRRAITSVIAQYTRLRAGSIRAFLSLA
jgi:hypothetical protein